MAAPIWVVDTSALIQIKSSIPHGQRPHVFITLTALVTEGRLMFPPQVLHELERDSEGHAPDQVCSWALSVEATACALAASYEEVKAVLAIVPDVLDSMKDPGVDEPVPHAGPRHVHPTRVLGDAESRLARVPDPHEAFGSTGRS